MHHLRNRMPNHQFSSICNQLTCLSVKFCQKEISLSWIYLSRFIRSSDDIVFTIQRTRTRSVNFSVTVIGYQGIIIKIPYNQRFKIGYDSNFQKVLFWQKNHVKKRDMCINCFLSDFFKRLIVNQFRIHVINLFFARFATIKYVFEVFWRFLWHRKDLLRIKIQTKIRLLLCWNSRKK